MSSMPCSSRAFRAHNTVVKPPTVSLTHWIVSSPEPWKPVSVTSTNVASPVCGVKRISTVVGCS
ncbi:hypothetical protein HNR40_003285 [Nonomuraea endophytica]|uniref:Uncharacterized protein n=1 Tax=Nonomuraea endophytica TaxID=714136 RepID=A0A7W8A2U3_9ACTN|nr:hypothetical protein [Nonomuraea endophytica]MBB5077810.1 hypothetical protein [Nonomuraea endophytica]